MVISVGEVIINLESVVIIAERSTLATYHGTERTDMQEVVLTSYPFQDDCRKDSHSTFHKGHC